MINASSPDQIIVEKYFAYMYDMGEEDEEVKKRSRGVYEFLLAVIIVALILLPQLIGTKAVTDESAGLDENGYPTTEKTLAELEAPGTRFGSPTIHEWMDALQSRFPEGKVLNYPNMANLYAALDSGEIDAAMGFLDERKTIAETHPNLALIEGQHPAHLYHGGSV